jgi:ribosomal protein S19
MSKEQTPIEQILRTTLVIDNPKGIKYAVKKLEEHLNAKVLEALEREFSKIKIKERLADSAGDYIGETSIVFNGKEYYETEVRPNYKL